MELKSKDQMEEEKKVLKDPGGIQELLGLKDAKNMPEWLTHILSAIGGMGGSYVFMIKPLQERIDNLAREVGELQKDLKELKEQNNAYAEELEEVNLRLENNLSGGGYLPIKRSSSQVTYTKRRI